MVKKNNIEVKKEVPAEHKKYLKSKIPSQIEYFQALSHTLSLASI